MSRTAKLHENEAEGQLRAPREARPAQPIGATMLCCSLLGAMAMFSNVMFREEIDAIKEWTPPNSTTTRTTTVTTFTSTSSTSWITRTFTTTKMSDDGRRVALTARLEGRSFACGKSSKEACDLPFMGVNIGGWLVLEDDLLPGQMKDQGIHDEWSYIKQLGGPSSPGAVQAMKEHWETFITDKDLDELQSFGVTHVRVPVGYWLVDYNESDGFVYRGQLYLFRFLAWLKQRGMKAVIVLQAVPGGQVADKSSTGRRTWEPAFFLDQQLYERGQKAMYKLAEWIVQMNENKLTEETVVGLELLNEPDWQYWSRTPGIRDLYQIMVPRLRKLLPAEDCALLLSFAEPTLGEGLKWLAQMREKHPEDYTGVFYDAHISHADTPGSTWHVDADTCKTCCRDPLLLTPLAAADVPVVIGQYSLDVGLPNDPDAWRANVAYFHNQLSLWASTPGVLGSFFWNHRVLVAASSTAGNALAGSLGNMSPPDADNASVENNASVVSLDDMSPLSLLDLIQPGAPLSLPWNSSHTDLVASGLCPDEDLTKCPMFSLQSVGWTDECHWLTREASVRVDIVQT